MLYFKYFLLATLMLSSALHASKESQQGDNATRAAAAMSSTGQLDALTLSRLSDEYTITRDLNPSLDASAAANEAINSVFGSQANQFRVAAAQALANVKVPVTDASAPVPPAEPVKVASAPPPPAVPVLSPQEQFQNTQRALKAIETTARLDTQTEKILMASIKKFSSQNMDYNTAYAKAREEIFGTGASTVQELATASQKAMTERALAWINAVGHLDPLLDARLKLGIKNIREADPLLNYDKAFDTATEHIFGQGKANVRALSKMTLGSQKTNTDRALQTFQVTKQLDPLSQSQIGIAKAEIKKWFQNANEAILAQEAGRKVFGLGYDQIRTTLPGIFGQ